MVKLTQIVRKVAGDLQTPVGLYLKIRDIGEKSALLESSDFHTQNNSYSFVCAKPIGHFKLDKNVCETAYPNGESVRETVQSHSSAISLLKKYLANYRFEGGNPLPSNGFFGYTSYDCAEHFDAVKFAKRAPNEKDAPEMYYVLYRFTVSLNHFNNELVVVENLPEGESSQMDEFLAVIHNNSFAEYSFERVGTPNYETSGEKFMQNVAEAIKRIKLGDIFQIVISRGFNTRFKGDDFKVYRALRRINPSPYLFYFDFGGFRIFGSSPETHLKIVGDTASIDPIAGTFKRTGNDEKDSLLAAALLKDPKENSEHTMLVDLARNDLSRSCLHTKVEFLKQIQYYSHLIHMVSRVSAKVPSPDKKLDVLADAFPAGTLSGAPKIKAMQIIDELESDRRSVYGGCIGFIGFNGDLNQAITIRTFFSKNNTLYFKAGAGIVVDSKPENELQEINNKLGALMAALDKASEE